MTILTKQSLVNMTKYDYLKNKKKKKKKKKTVKKYDNEKVIKKIR
jgi:hypothetical protein